MIQIVAIILALLFAGALAFIGWRRKLTTRLYWRKIMLTSLLILLSVLAGFLPLVQADDSEVITNTDIIFLVDTTYSMNALDGRDGDTRLADVQHDIKTFSQKLVGSRFGIMTFNSTATIYLPLTATTSDVQIATETLTTAAYNDSVSDPNFGTAFTKAKDYFDQVAKIDATRQRVLVVMTDGELTGKVDTASSVESAASKAAGPINAAMVIGYGTEAGAKMPEITNDLTNGAQKRLSDIYMYGQLADGQYGDIVSRRDQTFLQALAGSLKGKYVAAQNTGDSLSTLMASRSQAAADKAHSPENVALSQNILHVPFAIILLLWLVLIEVASGERVRAWLSARRKS